MANSVNSTENFNSIDSTGARLGWTSGPNYRGTLDIIWSCAITLFLCCWSILVVNVPAPGSNAWQFVVRKLCLVGLCAMAPELVFQIALGQWLAARESVTLFHASGYQEWTIRHGFYANMGGFRFQPADWKAFPVDAKQLHYLVTRGYIKYEQIRDVHIRDKNKVDGMLRLITLVQTLWFVLNVIVRASQQLTVTALELSTVAFVWLGVASSLCWFYKPADVEQADCVTCETSMASILLAAGDAASGVYYYTPMDFASRAEWTWSRLWNHGLNLLRYLRWSAPPVERPLPRFQNSVIPAVQGWYYVGWVIISTTYFLIFLLGWNFSFPTRIEVTLWRCASLVALVSALMVCFAMHWYSDWYPKLKAKMRRSDPGQASVLQDEQQTHSNICGKTHGWFESFLDILRNNSVMRDPSLDTSASLVIVTWVCGIFYVSARAYVVIADVIELRSLPVDAYHTVDWASVIPHF